MEEIGTERAVQLIKPEKKENDSGETITTFTLQTKILEKLLLTEEVRDRIGFKLIFTEI